MSRRYFAAVYSPHDAEILLVGVALTPAHAQELLTNWMARRPAKTAVSADGVPMISAELQPLVLSDQTVPIAETEAGLDELIDTDASVHMLATMIFDRVTAELVEFIKDVAKLPECGHPIDEGIALAERASALLDRR